MKNNRDDFTKSTIENIAARVGYKCSNPNCKVETRGPHSNVDKKVSIGEAAHITAASPGGPRYDDSLTPEQRRSNDNGIWLCRTHARLIDSDVDTYPVELLRSWKAQAEYEQYLIMNNINSINNINLNRNEYKTALKDLKKSIDELNSIYLYLKEYFDKNLSMFGSFIEVNNKISERWILYGKDLSNAVTVLDNCIDSLSNKYSEYELDMSEELQNKIKEYLDLTIFTYENDGMTGFYNNYYEKLFEMIDKNYNKILIIKEEIDSIIKMEYGVGLELNI